MIHLGDITKIRGCVAPVVDVMIGGSPCQDLSIAGKRAGFSGERSVLLLAQIRVTKEMRYVDSLRGRTGEFIRPRYMVWENVPGAFSSNRGKDFGAVLTEMVRVVEPEAPTVPMPKAGWPNSGCLHGMVSGGGTGVSPGAYSTHSFGECPKDGAGSCLSQILEAEPHRKYYLSAKACQGILNRAARRGKDLPEALKAALLMQSESGGAVTEAERER